MKSWERILEGKPQALAEYVLDQIAGALAEDVRNFPPRIDEWEDEAERARWAEVLARPSKPPQGTIRVACELAREELLREYELIDRFVKSPRFPELLPEPLEQRTAHFLTRWLVDGALSFQEQGQGKFKRRDLVALLEKVEERLLRGFTLRL